MESLNQLKDAAHVGTDVDQGFLMFVAENSGICPEDLEKLFYNGFDDPHSFELLTIDQLQALGVNEDVTALFDKIMATVEVYNDYFAKNGAYVSVEQRQLASSDLQNSSVGAEFLMSENQTIFEEVPQAAVPKNAKPITEQLLLGKFALKPRIQHNLHL